MFLKYPLPIDLQVAVDQHIEHVTGQPMALAQQYSMLVAIFVTLDLSEFSDRHIISRDISCTQSCSIRHFLQFQHCVLLDIVCHSVLSHHWQMVLEHCEEWLNSFYQEVIFSKKLTNLQIALSLLDFQFEHGHLALLDIQHVVLLSDLFLLVLLAGLDHLAGGFLLDALV